MEDARGEAEGLDTLDAQVLQLLLLALRKQRRRGCPCFVEVGLHCGTVVGDSCVSALALGENDVNVDLTPIQVLLAEHREVDDVAGINALCLRVALHQGSARHDQGLQFINNLLVSFLDIRRTFDLLHTQGGCAAGGLQDSWEADLLDCLLYILRGLDEKVPRGWETCCLQAGSGGVLVSGVVHRAWPVAWETQALSQSGHQGDRQLHESSDAIRSSCDAVLTQALDVGQGLLENNVGGLRHVHRQKLCDNTVLHEALAPRAGVLDDDDFQSQSSGTLKCEPLAWQASRDDDDGGAIGQLPSQTLALIVLAEEKLLGDLGEHLVGGRRNDRSDHSLTLLAVEGPGECSWTGEDLFSLELGSLAHQSLRSRSSWSIHHVQLAGQGILGLCELAHDEIEVDIDGGRRRRDGPIGGGRGPDHGVATSPSRSGRR
mmetsp:Transcript_51644/g.109732  ORF Transcript_51644/g.109732 Transcript_51644/m.109732 type:complete len:431 (-) Transcript_51644:262-1554(-)